MIREKIYIVIIVFVLCLHCVVLYLLTQLKDLPQSPRQSKQPHRLIIELQTTKIDNPPINDTLINNTLSAKSKRILDKSVALSIADDFATPSLNNQNLTNNQGSTNQHFINRHAFTVEEPNTSTSLTADTLSFIDKDKDLSYFADLHQQVRNSKIDTDYTDNQIQEQKHQEAIDNQSQNSTEKSEKEQTNIVIEDEVVSNKTTSNELAKTDKTTVKPITDTNKDNEVKNNEADDDENENKGFEAFYREQNRYQTFVYGENFNEEAMPDIPVFADLLYVSEKQALKHLLEPLQPKLPSQLIKKQSTKKQSAQQQWRVVVVLYVDKQGNVMDNPQPRIRPELSSDNPLIDENALQLVRELKFKPFSKNGKSIVAEVELPLQYQ